MALAQWCVWCSDACGVVQGRGWPWCVDEGGPDTVVCVVQGREEGSTGLVMCVVLGTDVCGVVH